MRNNAKKPIPDAELDKPLTNRGFLIGCALVAESIQWADQNDTEVEGFAKILQRAHKAFQTKL